MSSNPGWFGSAAVMLFVALGPGPASAQESDGAPAVAGTSAAPVSDAGPVHVLAKVSGLVGWDTAGVASASLLLGTGISRWQVGVRAFAGIATGGVESSLGAGGEAGHRALWRLGPRLTATLLTSASYTYRRAHDPHAGWYYRYHIVQGHLGVGLIFGKGAGLSHGVELGGGGGYAFHIDPRSTDYSGFYGGGELGYVLLF